MGMAASQARLLFLTARMHDIEFEAQAIQGAKVQLATQSDDAYRKYNEALDDETLTLQTNNGLITATFNTLCSKNAMLDSNKRIALINNKGQLIVPDDVAEGYENFMDEGSIEPKDAYNFAIYMMGDVDLTKTTSREAELETYEKDVHKSGKSKIEELYNNALEILKSLCKKYGADEPQNIYDINNFGNDVSPEDLEKYNLAVEAFKAQLYKTHADDVYNRLVNGGSDGNVNGESGTKENAVDFNDSDFNYYVSIFNQIQSVGDCVSIDDYKDPLNGASISNSEEWLSQMINSGFITVANVDVDNKTGDLIINDTSPSSDSRLGFTPTTSIDKKALAKAEAEYEHELKQIDKKDKQYDLTLSKLETEREALKTEYDQVKKVAQDNIDRTFGIFS